MAVTKDTPTTWTCVDPMGTRYDPKATETAGTITGGVSGYFTTHRPEVAQEIQARYPHMLVTPHETSHMNRATRTISFTMPLTLAELAERYKQHQEAQTGAVTPQEEPHVSEHAPE